MVSLLLSCGAETDKKKEESTGRPVKMVVVGKERHSQSLSYPAVIGSSRLAELSFQVGGLLEELRVLEAQNVERGTVIAKLDKRDFQSNFDSAKADFDNSEEEYQRAVRLAKENAISLSVLKQRKSRRDIAKTQMELSGKALGDTVLTAPFSGFVAKLHVEELSSLRAGEPVATLLGEGELEAIINLPASVIAKIKTRTRKETFVVLDAAPQIRIPATFKEAALEADPVSQTYEVKLSFKSPKDLTILPGMNAKVITTSSVKDPAGQTGVSLPLAAITTDSEGLQYVWVVNENSMTVSKRRIQVKDGIGETVEVERGLAAGETVVGAGASYLTEGAKVRPWTDGR